MALGAGRRGDQDAAVPPHPKLPTRAGDALRVHPKSQRHVQLAAGDRWQGAGLVFCTSVGTALDAANVRRSFRRVAAAAGLDAQAWTPRELRHSFVSLLSSTGMSIEDISHLLATPAAASPSWCTTRSCGRCSPAVRARWTLSSRMRSRGLR
jgi:site-specific recombinase XerD